MRSILPQDKNPHLRDISHEIPVSHIRSTEVRKLISDMRALLAKERYGVALAAVQVGEPVRLFIVSGKALARDARNAHDEQDDQSDKEAVADQVYINPTLLKISRGRKEKHEGCLSIRGIWGEVPRAEKAAIRAFDEEGREFTRGASGFLAHIFQHEMDHLEGILYTDKAIAIYEEKDERTEAKKQVEKN